MEGLGITDAQEMISPGVRLADHFPSVLPPCKEAAAEFFYCFTEAGKTNRMIPSEALMVCFPKMQKYDKCMVEALSKTKK